jgi:hypothetical protein
VIEESVRNPASPLSVSMLALQEIESLPNHVVRVGNSAKSTLLLKIAVICPTTRDIADESFADLVAKWIDSRIKLHTIDTAVSKGYHPLYEVRSVVVMGSNYEICSSCDSALILIPPSWSDPRQKASMLGHVASSILDDNVPRVALAFSDDLNTHSLHSMNKVIAGELAGNMKSIPIIHPSQLSREAFETAFEFAVKRTVKIFINETCVRVSRIPAMLLASKVIKTVLWQCIPPVSRNGDEDVIVECSRVALTELIKELSMQFTLNRAEWSSWPPSEFASPNGTIETYYGPSEGSLPLQWTRCLDREFLEEIYDPLLNAFLGHFRDVFQRILVDAPTIVRDDCAYQCAQGHYKRCLEKSLSWLEESSTSAAFLYLPDGLMDLVLKAVVSQVQTLPFLKKPAREETEASLENRDQNMNEVRVLTEMESFVGSEEISSGNDLDITATNVSQFSNKRRRSVQPDNDGVDKDLEENFMGCDAPSHEKRRRQEDVCCVPTRDSVVSSNLKESDEFTRKLERLLRGDTVDMFVGDASLSHILRNVPKMGI